MKKTLSLTLILTLIIGLFSIVPVSAGTIFNGDFEYNVLDDGTLEVSKYNGREATVTVPSTLTGGYKVTSIGDEAFMYNNYIKSVVISEGITSIGDSAFYYCKNLESISLPSTLKECEPYTLAFTGIKELTIPKLMTRIPTRFCHYAESLKKVTAKSVITNVEDYAFSYTALTDISFLGSVKSIGEGAFWSCYDLKINTLPSSLNTIGTYAFSYCKSLTSFTLPKSITNYGFGIFYGSSLETLTFEYGTTKLYDEAYECENLKTLIIPDSVTEIGDKTFDNSPNLCSVKLSENLTYIGENAFKNCPALKTIKIPNTLKNVVMVYLKIPV